MLYTFQHSKKFLDEQNIQSTVLPQPKWIIKQGNTVREILQQLSCIEGEFYTFFYSAGTRILFPFNTSGHFYMDAQKTIERFSGRRIRIWHAFVQNKKLSIQLGYIKFFLLDKAAKAECLALLKTDASTFWRGKGCKYVESCGGKLFPHKKLEFSIKNMI